MNIMESSFPKILVRSSRVPHTTRASVLLKYHKSALGMDFEINLAAAMPDSPDVASQSLQSMSESEIGDKCSMLTCTNYT